MTETVRLAESSGSPQRVAFDLLRLIKQPAMSKEAILDLYAECLEATLNHRDLGPKV